MAAPERTCRVCHQRAAKAELARWSLVSGQLQPDPLQNQPGRGFYTDSPKCAQILPDVIKKKAR